MPRTRKTIPRYSLHPQSGRGRIRYYDATGNQGEEILPGPFNYKESTDAFACRSLEISVAPLAQAAEDQGG